MHTNSSDLDWQKQMKLFRRHRRTGGLQQAPRQYDNLSGFPRAEHRQSRRRGARVKLDATTRTQAAIKAAIGKLIDP
jgi:hypothetical protein